MQNEYYPSDSPSLLKNKFSKQRIIVNSKQGINIFNGDNKLSYMDSSIDLT